MMKTEKYPYLQNAIKNAKREIERREIEGPFETAGAFVDDLNK